MLDAMQGGLPTFLDIGQSFSASAITEDNLLQQLLARNKTLVGLPAVACYTCCTLWCSCNAADQHTV